MREVYCKALAEARRSGGIEVYAYVVMHDHVHLITNSTRTIKDTLRFINGISARRLIDHLKAGGHETSLRKLRMQDKGKNYKYSLWQHHPHVFTIHGEDVLMQKIGYLHLNPVRAGLVDEAFEYRHSSVRFWTKRATDDEPFVTDHRLILWR